MKNFHKYKFKIKEMPLEKSEYQKIQVTIRRFDNEAYLYSINGGGNYSLYLQDRFYYLNIDNETKNIVAFEGDLTSKN